MVLAPSRRPATPHRADKSVADQRASAEKDVRAAEEQLQRCKDGSSMAEKEAAARQKKLADDLSTLHKDEGGSEVYDNAGGST